MGTSSALKSLVLLPVSLAMACSSEPSTQSTLPLTGGLLTTQTGGHLGTGGVLGTGGGMLGTGGVALGTGGTVSGTGGDVAMTGGQLPVTGGQISVTGGVAGTGGESVGTGGVDVSTLGQFSFFVTSLDGLQELSGSIDCFGGNYASYLGAGSTDGLGGADKICRDLAERAAPGYGAKTWRAFLSVTDGGDGQPAHAIDRIGTGPWYDRNERLVANDIAGLLHTSQRPDGDAQTKNDLPDEFGVALSEYGDSHDIVTGSNDEGRLDISEENMPYRTCNDWTSTTVDPRDGTDPQVSFSPPIPIPGVAGGVRIGHAWPRSGGFGGGDGDGWIGAHTESTCAAGVNPDILAGSKANTGPGDGTTIGNGGGWGGIYCFALEP